MSSSDTSQFDSYSHSYYSNTSDYCSTCSMQTTPSRRGLSDAGYTISDMKDDLKRDVGERFVSDKLSVKDFVRCVWGMEQHVIDTILNATKSFKESKILSDLIQRYKSAAARGEPSIYEPFSNLAQYLSGQLKDMLPGCNFINRLHSERGKLVLNSGCNKRKPDTIVVPNEYKGKFDWEHVVVPFEFKTKNKRADTRSSQGKVALSASPKVASSSLSKLMSTPDNGQPSQSFDDGLPFAKVESRYHKLACSHNVTSNMLPISSTNANATNKHATSVTSHASDQPTPHASKVLDKKSNVSKGGPFVKSHGKAIDATSMSGRPKKVNVNHETKSRPGLSSTASSNKRLADDITVPPFPKRRKSELHATVEQLQLAMYAVECLATSSRHYVAGVFIHNVNISLWYYDRAVVARTVNFDFETQPEMLTLVLYALLMCESRRAGFDPFIIPASHLCPSNIDELYAAPTSIAQSEDDKFIVMQGDGTVKQLKITGKRLFANRCLVGRGTVVFPVQAINEDGISDERKVIKVSWPGMMREREALLIRELRKAIPEMAKHLPDVTSFADFNTEQLSLPRQLLGITVIETLERDLHVMAIKRYEALWDVNSVDEFKEVFVDCVECHYAAFRRGRLLHRDLSTNNLMSDWDEENDCHVGILSDWDLSSRVDGQMVVPSNLDHRTGTVPFMSINLLSESPPPHRYCHDLESFLYILLWASVHFNLDQHVCEKPCPKFFFWNSPNLEVVADVKTSFITNPSKYSTFVKEDFRELFKTWINTLRIMFRDAYYEDTIVGDGMHDGVTLARLEKLVTFESFMAAIGREPRYTYTS